MYIAAALTQLIRLSINTSFLSEVSSKPQPTLIFGYLLDICYIIGHKPKSVKDYNFTHVSIIYLGEYKLREAKNRGTTSTQKDGDIRGF